jgi:hypothetical protein
MAREELRPRRRTVRPLVLSLVVLVIVAAGGYCVWYRATYHAWPLRPAASQLHYCARDYEFAGGPAQPLSQIVDAGHGAPLRYVGGYPPLGPQRQLYAFYTSDPPDGEPCTMILYAKIAPDRYLAYPIEGGP